MFRSKSLKTYFIQIILFASLIPFAVSVTLFAFVIYRSAEREELAQKQQQKNFELELIDSLAKVQSAAYMVDLSEELEDYFDATLNTEFFYKKRLEKMIFFARNSLLFENTHWVIYGLHGNVLFQVPQPLLVSEREPQTLPEQPGVYLSDDKTKIKFFLPVSYRMSRIESRITHTLGFISIVLPVESVKKTFPNLLNIDYLPVNLKLTKSTQNIAKIKIDSDALQHQLLLYFYILISFLFTCVALFVGLKIFQSKIINKLIFLTSRVRNETNFPVVDQSKNEIESLSEAFILYFKYTFFLQKEMERASQLAAVGNLVHLIAHDVRKPFSQVQLLLDEIKNCHSIEKIDKVIEDYSPNIRSSLEYIEHILTEVMDAKISNLNLSRNVRLESLIKKAFLNISSLRKAKNIYLSHDFKHTHTLKIDEQRMMRVFVNIIENAFEAMNYSGHIWISTQEIKVQTNEKESVFLELCIRNNNSFISPEHMERLFEPFFTYGKTLGTGLGLSIAHQIVSLHGGQISCRSDKEKGVEFVIELPVDEEIYLADTSELPFYYGESKKQTQQNDAMTTAEPILVLIDDDPLTCQNWKRNVRDARVFSFLSPEEFFDFCKMNEGFLSRISIIVSDFYFGRDSKISFKDFVVILREKYRNKIFLSSDASQVEVPFLSQFQIFHIEKRAHSFGELSYF